MKKIHYYNAGAGSGKTYKLTHILADRIQEGLNPSEVILTTFTKDAARDFKERARAVLYEQGLRDKAALLDQAVIGTVHSVGEQFIKQYWYLLGLSPEMNVLDDNSKQLYINQSIATLPTPEDIELFDKFCDVLDLKKSKENNSPKPYDMFWKDWLEKIIEHAVTCRIESMNRSMEYSIAQIHRFLKPDANLVFDEEQGRKIMQNIKNHVAGKDTKTDVARVETADKFLRKNAWSIKDWIQLSNFLEDDKHKTLKNKIPGVKELAVAALNIWHSQQLFHLVTKVVKRIFTLADQWRLEYKRYKEEQHIIDFNDMEYYFLQLLKRPDFEAEFKGRFTCIMVDEFQDSSPMQVEIFLTLSNILEECYWCGDSKQAIYGFRGTDTDLTEAVVSMIPKENITTLNKSYRSEPDVVNFCNQVFTRAFAGKLDEKNVVLEPVREKSSMGANLIHWHCPYTKKNDFFNYTAKHIDDFTQKYNIPYNEVAVLARKNSDLNKMADYLNDIGIPVNRSHDLLNEQRESKLICAILTLVMDGHNELAKAEIAHFTEKGWNLQHIIDDRLTHIKEQRDYDRAQETGEADALMKAPDEWLNEIPMVRQILNKRKKWLGLSVSALIECLMVELNLRAVLKSWTVNWNELEMNVFQIIELAKMYEEECQTLTLGATIAGFLDYFDADQTTKTADNSEGVVLTTYHKAKGLEWKNVVLMSLEENVIEEKEILKKNVFDIQKIRTEEFSKENLFPEMIISLIPYLWGTRKMPEDIATEAKADEQFAKAKKTALEESARLLYVGMTRAKERLITTSYTIKSKTNQFAWITNLNIEMAELPESGDVDLFGTGICSSVEKQERIEFVEQNEEECPLPTSKDFKLDALEKTEFAAKFLAPSTLTSTDKGHVELMAVRNERIPLRGNPDMSEVGNCIHNIYAACNGDATHDLQTARRLVTDFGFDKVLPDTEAIINARQFLVQWLTEKYANCTMQYHELAFLHEVNGQVVRGSMDLVWETEDGCVLIDFKTFPGSETSVTEENNVHYAGKYQAQFAYYRKALEAAEKKVIASYVFYPVAGMIVSLSHC